MGLLRGLAGTNGGAGEQTLKKVCDGVVGPRLECGSSAWAVCAGTHQQSLDGVNSRALGVVMAAVGAKPTPQMQGCWFADIVIYRRQQKP